MLKNIFLCILGMGFCRVSWKNGTGVTELHKLNDVWSCLLLYISLICRSGYRLCAKTLSNTGIIDSLWLADLIVSGVWVLLRLPLLTVSVYQLLSSYGRPLSVSGRPCYILPMFFLYFFYGRLILRPWLTEVRESFTRGGPWVSLEKLVLGFFPGHP